MLKILPILHEFLILNMYLLTTPHQIRCLNRQCTLFLCWKLILWVFLLSRHGLECCNYIFSLLIKIIFITKNVPVMIRGALKPIPIKFFCSDADYALLLCYLGQISNQFSAIFFVNASFMHNQHLSMVLFGTNLVSKISTKTSKRAPY